ncbi:unnamed protein product [Durusdinium trenchii]|uniref:Uncharacterized protein n=1 Tax=Durusdinium trenchii TaxID=1381693 RepID=A0ABP0L6D5_9DINO
MSDCSGAEGAFFALKAINKRATLVSSRRRIYIAVIHESVLRRGINSNARLRLLFPRNHPVVVQDLKDRMERKHNQEDENINLTVKPRNKKPTWPSKHWDVMKDYKVNPKQVAETCKGQELQKLVSNLRQRHVQRDILCCIVDSMDKSKFRLPRFAQGRVPKPLENKKRWLKDRLQNTFQKSGLDFNVAYITNVRNWCDSMAAFSTLAGAYKKRKDDTKEIPHSFTFARRDRVAAYLDDDRKEVLLEVASYLEDNYSHYGRGILYLRQLAGQYALPRSPAPRIEFLLTRHAGIQRGAVILPNAEALIMLSVLALLVELEVTAEMMEEDPAMAKAVASMFYIKCNFKKHATSDGVANRTAEKVKPSALDLLLLFRESVRIKQTSDSAKKTSLRDLLFASVADYNKSVGNHRAWRVSDPTRRLIYNLLRSPVGLWDALKICYNESKPQDAALTMDNLDDDYFVVGNELVLLQVCCLMTYVWPKIQNFLGNGELLDGIMNQWKLGALDAELRVQVKLGTDDEAEGDDAGSLSADAILRDFRYNLQCIYMEPARDLRVRPICVFFDPATVYGTREGFHPALLVTSMDKHNVFLKSPVYKAGVVSGVGMLPRSEMVKAEKCGKYATDMRLTRVQKLVKSLISEDNTSNVIVDLLGFDAWPACFAMKELATGANFACSTACHSPNETSYCTSTIGEKLYGMCRSNQIKLPGFPEFEQVVADLRKSNSEVPPPEFQVCLPVPNGLAIRENLVEQWTSCDLVEVEMKELLKKHNDKYNPHGIKRGSSDQGTTEDPAPDAKRLRIDSSVKMAEHEAQIANKLVLNCGTFKLVYDSDQDILWAGAADGKKKDTFEAKGPLELFGFGSGDFLEGPDAKDVQQDLTGRWLTFKLESGSEHCILEADRRLPDHVKKMDIFGKVLTYADVLQQLENAGEVNTKMSMHWIDRAEGTGTITFRSAKNVVFVLDPPKNKDPKKQKKDSKAQLSMGWGNAGECV